MKIYGGSSRGDKGFQEAVSNITNAASDCGSERCEVYHSSVYAFFERKEDADAFMGLSSYIKNTSTSERKVEAIYDCGIDGKVVQLTRFAFEFYKNTELS